MHVVGTVQFIRSGAAFVIPEDRAEKEAGDIFVRAENLEGVLQGDRVRVRVMHLRRFRREGKIELILDRPHHTVVGRYRSDRAGGRVEPLDESFFHAIELLPVCSIDVRENQIVTVEITTPPIAGNAPVGRITEVLGDLGDEGIDAEIVIRKHHLRREFPAAVLEESAKVSEKISQSEIGRRRDLRDWGVFTIDGEDARDFDDAVSIRSRPDGGFVLGVHIADVSHYVQENTALDLEARERSTSVYFPRKVLPMLPPNLSDEICSLRPDEDRLAMSALLELDSAGEPVDLDVFESVIRSKSRLTYTKVQTLFDGDEEVRGTLPVDVVQSLDTMQRLALLRIERRKERGAIDFDLPEPEIVYDEEFQISAILPSKRLLAHQLIEEFMILANTAIARRLYESGQPSIYRIHDEPDPERVETFALIAAAFGYRFPIRSAITPGDYQKIASQFQGKKEERLLAYRLLRSLSLARYTTAQGKHFGLALEHYTHFTSPIRRYPDLVVHRQLKRLLEDESSRPATHAGTKAKSREKRATGQAAEAGQLEQIAEQSSRREREAEAAERELFNWKKAEFLANKVGEHFPGIITDVREFGMFVELEEYLVDGLVSMSTLIDDEYRYYPKSHAIVGKRGRSFRLGDRIEVLIDRVDRDRQLVDFSIYSNRKDRQRPRKR